jgi:hypothetical protein
MRMKLLEFRNWLLPVLLVSFIGPALPFFPEGFLISARWGVVAIVALFFLVEGKSLGLLHRPIFLTTVLYVSWCLLTYTWSLVPSLSLIKVVALGGVILTFLLAGHDWVKRCSVNESLSFTWLYVVVSLVAAFWGGASMQQSRDPSLLLYHGATENPNMLGSMMASSTPVIIWYLYRHWSNSKRRLLWGALLAACIVALYWTNARSAYFVFLGIVAGFLLAHGLRRSMALALAGTVIAGLTVFVAPELTEPFVQRNVYKYADDDQGVFYTRDQPWEDSYSAAAEGAWIGLGYGVSAGEHNFNVGLTAVGYGREKGNSQLAIVEETGIVGLILYAALLFALFPELVSAFRACRIAEHRMMMGLLIGTLSGLVLQSVFEAWWVAPGAPEFAYFWAVAGAALGAARMIRNQSVTHAVRASTALYPVST